jgi:mgtE-like transporter
MPALLKSILKQSIPVFMLCAVGGITAGLILDGIKSDLSMIPGILILLPAVLGMRGNISGALGSRIASALHLGLIQAELRWNNTLSENMAASLILNTLMSLFSGMAAYFAYTLTGNADKVPASLMQLTLIAFLAGTMAGVLLSGLTISLALITYSRGLDPDNVLAPLLATVGDILTVLCLLVAIRLVT